jgi:hypothetical protein
MHIAGPGFAFDAQERLLATVTTTGNFHARKLVVLVNPDTHDFEVDWERSALVNGLVAARFTVTEDNKTYDLTGQAEPLLEILQLFKDNGIPLGGPSDLRSADPALRQRLNDMVRRAAAAQPAPAYAAGGPGLPPTHQQPQRGPRRPSGCRSWPGSTRTRRSPTPSTRRSGGRSSRRSEALEPAYRKSPMGDITKH